MKIGLRNPDKPDKYFITEINRTVKKKQETTRRSLNFYAAAHFPNLWKSCALS